MSAALLAFMALAAYRLWRVFGKDDWPPSRWLRGVLEVQTDTWQGMANEDEATRLDRARAWLWYELKVMVECPWCLGTWCAVAVVAAVDAFASVPLPVLQAAAVACAVGLIGSYLDES